MPVLRFLRLLVTLIVLVGGPVSALGCGVAERAHGQVAQARAAAQLTRGHGFTGASYERLEARAAARNGLGDGIQPHYVIADVGDSSTPSAMDTVRPASRGRGGLLALLSHALADGGEEQDDEFEAGDAPDLLEDDDGPQAFAVVVFSGLSMPRAAAPHVEPRLREIQPSTGHPHGLDEPPRI